MENGSAFGQFKKGVLFSLGLLATFGAASLAFSAYVYVTDFPATASSGATLSSADWNKMVQALKNLDDGVQKSACESRRGVWSAGACQEYAYFGTAPGTYAASTCTTGYHKCTFPDLFTGGFASLRRPGYNAPFTYIWIAGSYVADQSSFFYAPWVGTGGGTAMTCAANSHYMMDITRHNAGNTAWGCYADSYNTGAGAACCKDNQ